MQPDLEMMVEGTYAPVTADGYHAPDSAYLLGPSQAYVALPSSDLPGYLKSYADTYASYAEGFEGVTDLMTRLGLTEEAARVMKSDPETYRSIDKLFLPRDDKLAYLSDKPLDSYKEQDMFKGGYKTQDSDTPPLMYKLRVEEDFSGMVKLFPDACFVNVPYISPKVDPMYWDMLKPDQGHLSYQGLVDLPKE